ncbi:MAG: HlyD family secretion protein, partial [Rhodanobacter sp.]
LELKQADAELALADIQAERDIAAVDALIPKSLISALDYDRHQGEMQRTDRALALKQLQVAQARGAVARRQQDSKLELAKQRASLVFYQAQVDGAVVRADRAGTVVHGFDSIFSEGGRYEEGSTSYPGIQVGQVVGEASGHTVQAWVLEPDRVGLRLDQPLQLHVDALPGSSFRGSISTIAGAPAERAGWGDGRYFELGIALPAGVELRLHQGMSVRVDSDLSDVQKHADKASIAHPPALKVDGEVFAQSSLAISPPSVDGLWQMTVSQMADDGQSLKKGDMLVAFEASEVVKNLTLKQGTLAENRRKQEQLRLDLADRAREAELATAQAQAETDKAQRKAHQPKDFIARVDYQKLVIARVKAERRLSLTAHRQQVALRERRAEQVMADAEVAALETEVDSLQKSLASLTVKA